VFWAQMQSTTFVEGLFEFSECIYHADSCFRRCTVDTSDHVVGEYFLALGGDLPC